MNTKGHHSIADTAGVPLLKQVLGKNTPGLDAFYLGNWLTDVSQAVDPVAYASATNVAKSTVEDISKAIKNSLSESIELVLRSTWLKKLAHEEILTPSDKIIELAKNKINTKIDFLLSTEEGDDNRSARIAGFFRSAFLVKGYFKFVHPDIVGQKPKLDFDCFMQVFGKPTTSSGGTSPLSLQKESAYTQYYPHEHVDRPEILPQETPSIYAPGRQIPFAPFRVAYGKKAGTRSPRASERLNPDLYSYLRDHIEMTAGLLAEVDLEFKKYSQSEIKDKDCQWYVTLAKLGHALHQVEDYFAHSNWIELVAKSRGKKYLEKNLPRSSIQILDRQHSIFQKRLSRHLTDKLKDPEGWKKHKEDWVVTGYFDFRDTLISLSHISEELWGGHVDDPVTKIHNWEQTVLKTKEKPSIVADKAGKLMKDTLDFVTDPVRAYKNKENATAKALRNKYEKDVKRILRPGVKKDQQERLLKEIAGQAMRSEPLLMNAPAEVQGAFLDLIVKGGFVLGVHGLSVNIYNVLQELAEFVANPLNWLLTWIPDLLPKEIKEAALYYGKELFYDAVGANRVGCHSLMAKDHGKELFYKQQKDCSTALHWYVISMMLRWKTEKEPQYIDWLELLEYFLRNPTPQKKESTKQKVVLPVTVEYITQKGDQIDSIAFEKSLTKRFRRTAYDRRKFTWRTIADANYGTLGLSDKQTQRIVNETLKATGGIPVKFPNYAFKPGTKIRIPNQKWAYYAYTLTKPGKQPNWYIDVIDKGWKVFPGYEDESTQSSIAGKVPHEPKPISLDQVKHLIIKTKRMRRESREAYRPKK